MALTVNSKTVIGANLGRPSVRCAAVPLGHVRFTPPVINPARAPATRKVSTMTYSNVPKRFLVVQAHYGWLDNQLEGDDDPDVIQADTRDVIDKTVTDTHVATDDKLDTQKGPQGIWAILNAIKGISQQK